MKTISKSEVETSEIKWNDSSTVTLNDSVQKLQLLITSMGLEVHPIMNDHSNCCDDELQLRKENYFGRLSKMFIEQRILNEPGVLGIGGRKRLWLLRKAFTVSWLDVWRNFDDEISDLTSLTACPFTFPSWQYLRPRGGTGDYAVSRTHDDNFRFSLMSEKRQIFHLPIVRFCGIYTFDKSIYPLATSVDGLIQQCIHSPMNVLSAILRTSVTLRHFVNSNIGDKDKYSLTGLFLKEDDIVGTERLISRKTEADCFLGTLSTLKKCEQVVIKVMNNYNTDELDNICRELHISNLLRRHIPIESVVPVQAVQLFRSPYMVIYPFMNCGSYPDFVQRRRPHLTFMNKIEIAQIIARVLADMHFLGLLHCNIEARNIFVRETILTTNSEMASYSLSHGYKYCLGGFRKSHIGKIKKVNPHKSINIRWLAPEVFKTNELTQASDVFAFGITLYEIFTGNLPYFSMNSEQIRAKLLAGQRIRPEIRDIELPQRVLKLMQRCWRTDFRERPTMNGVWLEIKAIEEIELSEQQCSECYPQERPI